MCRFEQLVKSFVSAASFTLLIFFLPVFPLSMFCPDTVMDSNAKSAQFCSDDIDQILERNSRVIKVGCMLLVVCCPVPVSHSCARLSLRPVRSRHRCAVIVRQGLVLRVIDRLAVWMNIANSIASRSVHHASPFGTDVELDLNDPQFWEKLGLSKQQQQEEEGNECLFSTSCIALPLQQC